MTVTDVLY